MATQTEKLKIKLIQPTDKFADETFNAVINDIDDKVVGIAHLESSGHWATWEKNKEYDVNDIIRISDTKSNQYYQCVSKGTSGAKEPTNNVTGSIVVDGTVKWVVMAIGSGGSSSSVDSWSSDSYYSKGTIALYNNKLYRCKIAHTSLATFKDDAPYWQEVKASNTMWATGVYYLADDVIVKDNKLYKCKTSHTSTTFDADIANWKLLGDFSLVNPFAISTEYEEGQFVTYNGILYRCNTRHTSSSVDFATDLANWDVVYANTVDWDINTYYPKETIVLHDNLYYQCLSAHTSSADFEADRANWQLLSNVPANIQNWAISKYYYTGQCVLVDGIIYRCKTAHTSAATKFDADSANWEQIGGVGGAAIWQASKPYSEGQLIIKDNIIYRCNTKHTSSTDFKNDITNWDIVNANIVDWKVSTYYPKDTIVQHDNLFFKNTVAGVSDSADFENDRANWILMNNVPANLQAWQANKYYYAGQSILKDKNIYVCTKSHLSDTTFNLDLPNWTATGSSTLNEWATKTTYTVGDIVITNDKIYQCITNHTSGTFATDLNNGDWKEISSYRIVIDDWKPSTKYIVGDLVANDKKIYRCVTANTSDATAFKNDKSYWEELSPTLNEIADWTASVKYEQKDLVIYNNSLYRCNTAHTSTSFNSDIANWDLIKSPMIYKEFSGNTLYLNNEVVYLNGVPYRCIKTHVSTADADSDKDNFVNLYSNIRHYANNTFYREGVHVIYDNKLYECIKTHTSENDTIGVTLEKPNVAIASYTGKTGVTTKDDSKVIDLGIEKSVSTINWKTSGSTAGITKFNVQISTDGTTYNKLYDYDNSSANEGANDVIPVYQKARYIKFNITEINLVNSGTTDSSISMFTDIYVDSNNWQLIAPTDTMLYDWQADKQYYKNNFIYRNGKLLICTQDHYSGSTYSGSYWGKLNSTDIVEWQPSTEYNLNEVIQYNDTLYVCTKAHNSNSVSFDNDATNWKVIYTGIKPWVANKYYMTGAQVIYENKLYTCVISNNRGQFVTKEWIPFSRSIQEWEHGADIDIISILQFDNSVNLDELGNIWTITGNPLIDQVNMRHGKGCFSAKSTGYITVDLNEVQKNITEYTISFWLYMTNNSSNILEDNGVKINFASYPTYTLATWNHIEIDVTGGTATLYLNGTNIGTLTIGTVSGVHTLKVGELDGSNTVLIDNFIIYNKVLHNTDFTVSTEYVDLGKYYTYNVGDYVEYHNALYRCILENNDSTFQSNHWEQVIIPQIVEWTANTKYYTNQIIYKDRVLYKVTDDYISSSTFGALDKLEILNSSYILDWQPNTNYTKNEVVKHDTLVLRCVNSHTSNSKYNSAEDVYWEAIGGGTINQWQPNNTYTVGDVVVYNDILYRCNTSHTSGTDFTTNSSYFTELGGSGGSGSGSSYKQITKMDITSPKEILIQVGSTVTFNLPPVEILKFKNVETQQTITECAFDNGDADDFTYDTKYVTFDGVMKENTEYTFNGTTTSLGGGYLTTTDEYIDFSTFKSIEKIDTSDATKTVITAVPQDQVIVAKGLLPLTGIKSLDSVKLKNTTTGSAVIKVAVTNNLKDYYTYNAGTFSAIDITNKSDFLTNGILPTTLESITDSEWKSFGTDIGFAYILSQTVSTESCYIDSLEMLMTLSGSWWKAIHGTDYDYGYISNNTLEVDLLKDGSYKINYAKSAGNGTDEDWATKLEAMSYALSL